MKRSPAHIVLIATALIAVLFGFVAAPLAVAASSAPHVAMTMDMDDADAMPCAPDTQPCPCCPKRCNDMVACLAGGVAIADAALFVASATMYHTKIDYTAASFAVPPARAGEPISRPPIV